MRASLAVLLCFAALGTLVYRSSLHGPFISDDAGYYFSSHNPLLQQFTSESVASMLDPWGEPARLTLNYAPVHLLLLALEWQAFGPETSGYRVVNLALHVLNSALIAMLLLSSGLPLAAAFLAGGLFLVHPANVEVVAWITQLKSLAATSFGLGALVLLGSRPRWATLLFAAALLTKFSAVAFLALGAGLVWCRPSLHRSWRWLIGWLALVMLVAPLQLTAFGPAVEHEGLDSGAVRLLTIASIGARYLWMAATGLGVSAFHEPSPALSPLDLRALAGLALGLLLGARLVFTLSRRREEGAYWLAAAAAFVPVSQIVTFRYPIADRYLYFMLPGLIGGALLLTTHCLAAIGPKRALRRGARGPFRIAFALGVVLLVFFSAHSAKRAPLWTHDGYLLLDAASNYPDGSLASYVRAAKAARRGDAGTAVAALRAAHEKSRLGFSMDFTRDERLRPISQSPEFQEFLLYLARSHIDEARRFGVHRDGALTLAYAHRAVGELDEAIAVVEDFLRRYPDDRRRPKALALHEELRKERTEEGKRAR